MDSDTILVAIVGLLCLVSAGIGAALSMLYKGAPRAVARCEETDSPPPSPKVPKRKNAGFYF